MPETTMSVIKRLLSAVACLLAIVTIWLFYILGAALGLWQPLIRPRGVPLSAHYVSRVEDGTWFHCVVNAEKNVDTCKAWDTEGRVLADGDFRLEGEDRAASQAELKPSSVISSGGHAYAIYLFGKAGPHSRILVPIDRQHPHTTGCKWNAMQNRLLCN